MNRTILAGLFALISYNAEAKDVHIDQAMVSYSQCLRQEAKKLIHTKLSDYEITTHVMEKACTGRKSSFYLTATDYLGLPILGSNSDLTWLETSIKEDVMKQVGQARRKRNN